MDVEYTLPVCRANGFNLRNDADGIDDEEGIRTKLLNFPRECFTNPLAFCSAVELLPVPLHRSPFTFDSRGETGDNLLRFYRVRTKPLDQLITKCCFARRNAPREEHNLPGHGKDTSLACPQQKRLRRHSRGIKHTGRV